MLAYIPRLKNGGFTRYLVIEENGNLVPVNVSGQSASAIDAELGFREWFGCAADNAEEAIEEARQAGFSPSGSPDRIRNLLDGVSKFNV